MSHKTIETVEVSKPTVFQKALKALAYPVAVATGIFYLHKNSRNKVYDTLQKRGEFKDIKDQEGRVVEKGAQSKLNDAYKLINEEAEKLEGAAKGKINKTLRKVLTDGSKEITKHLNSKGFKYTHQYIGALPLSQQIEIGAGAMGAATVALGVVLAIGDNKAIDRLTHKNKDAQAQR